MPTHAEKAMAFSRFLKPVFVRQTAAEQADDADGRLRRPQPIGRALDATWPRHWPVSLWVSTVLAFRRRRSGEQTDKAVEPAHPRLWWERIRCGG